MQKILDYSPPFAVHLKDVMKVVAPFSTVCNSLPPSYTPRAVTDYAALVPDIICQRGRHPSAPQDLGPAVLPGLIGALPGHTGHAQDPGFYLTLLILPYLFCDSCHFFIFTVAL